MSPDADGCVPTLFMLLDAPLKLPVRVESGPRRCAPLPTSTAATSEEGGGKGWGEGRRRSSGGR